MINADAAHIPLPDNSVQLIVTSPPYADMRKRLYGGIPAEQYVAWFKPIAGELLRVLRPRGSFILNIKENAQGGEMRTYVLELILALRQWGWLWKEEYIWHKTTVYPCAFPDRFPNAWERLLHFTKQRQIDFYKDAVKVPRTGTSRVRKSTPENGNAYDRGEPYIDTRDISGDTAPNATGNFYGLQSQDFSDTAAPNANGNNRVFNSRLAWAKRAKGMKYPRNVLEAGTAAGLSGGTMGSKWHPATFPKRIPEFFIKLFTVENDLVLDPFAGSGTTLHVAHDLKRRSVGLEINMAYARQVRLSKQPHLL